jgi:tryptophan synthase alpha chain
MTRIESRFEAIKGRGRKAFIPYVTAGDPDLGTTRRLILELDRRGADIIELGVPFSDPMADGPVIQRASERALRNRVGARDCLDLVREIRKESQVPIVLFSYFNPLLALGADAIGDNLRSAGVDGVLVTDLVPEEGREFRSAMQSSGIDTIFLVAPTSTDERIKLVVEVSSGFIYALSRTGVTGVRQSLSEAAASLVQRVRRFSDLPIAVGFGISTPDQVREVWQHADGAAVGSRLVAEIEENAGHPDLIQKVGALSSWLMSDHGAGRI